MSNANGVSSENMIVTVLPGHGVGSSKELKITEMKVIGNGSFGVVYSAKIEDDVRVAIKRVLQDKRFKNRELQIMKSLDHPNIVKLIYYFHKMSDEKEEYLNLVLEFFPLTIHQLTRNYAKQRQAFPIHYIKLYMFQLFRALNYLHCVGICHRDIKPQNLLVNTEKRLLQLCDFGSAKNLVKGEQNVSYICSRYYRAPELIFGSGDYTCAIDMWSAGTVVSELFLSQPIFPGDSGVDQLVEIIKVLGTPSREQIKAMNPNYQEFTFPQIRPHPWSKVFRSRVPNDGISLVSQLLCYIPQSRLSPAEACAHPFFDELRHVSDELSTYVSELFNWSEQETANIPEELREKILNTVG